MLEYDRFYPETHQLNLRRRTGSFLFVKDNEIALNLRDYCATNVLREWIYAKVNKTFLLRVI